MSIHDDRTDDDPTTGTGEEVQTCVPGLDTRPDGDGGDPVRPQDGTPPTPVGVGATDVKPLVGTLHGRAPTRPGTLTP